ncbi:unnamed protein product, partial [Ilex paraguariensis]
FPGLPPIKACQMPQPLLDRDDQFYHYFLNFASNVPRSNGIILNTLNHLNRERSKLSGMGFVFRTSNSTDLLHRTTNCRRRNGAFSAEQVREIAIGLERSDRKFLWV